MYKSDTKMGFDTHAIYQPINNTFNMKQKTLYVDAHFAKNLIDYYKIYDSFHAIYFAGIHLSALTLKRSCWLECE